jgi:hypothetical protein
MSEEEVSALDSVLPSDAGDDESEGNIEVTDSSEVDRDTMETVGSEKHKEEPEAAEEANAADKIVEVGRAPEPGEQPSGSQPTGEAEPQANVETQEPQAQAGPGEQPDESQHTAPLADGDEEGAQEAVDPELAEALKAYQDKVKKASDGRVDEDTMPPAPRGQTYEEASHDVAEEVPPGFVTAGQEADQQAREATDKVPTQTSQGTRATQPQPATQPEASTSDVSPDRLAEELDAVVAKFEEEMDKAAQNK